MSLLSPNQIARTGLFLGIMLLAACAQTPQVILDTDSQNARWQQQQTQAISLSHWKLLGKLGIRTPDQSDGARINWQQADENFDIQLTTALGQAAVSLSGSAENVLLSIAGRGEYATSSPERLLMEELGWTLPLSSLNYWVRGIPSPEGPANYQLNEQGLMASLQQAGWQLTFSRYQQLESFSLPGKILLQQGDIQLTLVIKQWSQLDHS